MMASTASWSTRPKCWLFIFGCTRLHNFRSFLVWTLTSHCRWFNQNECVRYYRRCYRKKHVYYRSIAAWNCGVPTAAISFIARLMVVAKIGKARGSAAISAESHVKNILMGLERLIDLYTFIRWNCQYLRMYAHIFCSISSNFKQI